MVWPMNQFGQTFDRILRKRASQHGSLAARQCPCVHRAEVGGGVSGLEPVRRSRIYENIVEQIQRLIQDGQLKPGDQLPPERVLAETFHVSRASVREALRAL